MAQPTPYTRQYNFLNYQAEDPTTPLPGDKVDIELNRVKLTLDQTLVNLALIQRDDGEIANDSIGPDQLRADAVLSLNLDAIEAAQAAAATAVAAAAGAEASAGQSVTARNLSQAARDAALDAQAAAEAAADQASLITSFVDTIATFGMQVNGDCQISQAIGDSPIAVTADAVVYGRDQWLAFRHGTAACSLASVSIDPPSGYYRAQRLIMTAANASLAVDDYLVMGMPIEGHAIRRLGMGAAGARSLSVGFMLRSITTGPFYLNVIGNNRRYKRRILLSAANTWQWIQLLAIPGCTDGTWDTDAGDAGLFIQLCLAAGANKRGGATDTWAADGFQGGTDQVNLAATNSNYADMTGLIVMEGDYLPSSGNAAKLQKRPEQALVDCERFYREVRAGLDFKAVAGDDIAGASYPLPGLCPGPSPTITLKTAAGTPINVKSGYPTVVVDTTHPASFVYSLAADAAGRCASMGDVYTVEVRIA